LCFANSSAGTKSALVFGRILADFWTRPFLSRFLEWRLQHSNGPTFSSLLWKNEDYSFSLTPSPLPPPVALEDRFRSRRSLPTANCRSEPVVPIMNGSRWMQLGNLVTQVRILSSCIQMFGLPKMANRDFFGFSFSSVTVVVVDAHKSRRVHNFVYDILCCCTKYYLPATMCYVLGYQQKSVEFRPQRIRIWWSARNKWHW